MKKRFHKIILLQFYLIIGMGTIQAVFAQIPVSKDSGIEKIKFERPSNTPYIPKTPGTFHSILVANPAITEFKGNTYFIFRGQGDTGHDQIGLWSTPANLTDGIHWENHQSTPILPVSVEADAIDNQHILDPAAIAKGDSLLVYYTAKSSRKEPNYTICLAVSTDGTTFKKYNANPIIDGGIAPEVIYHNELFYLFYQRQNEKGYWEVFLANSRNGIDFDTSKEQLVFGPSQQPDAFDFFSITTVRIFKEDNYFYMTYGGCTKYIDYPESIGLARSSDLIHWEKYSHNPILERGSNGSWDEGAVWFPTVRNINGKYFMWYEGAGTGMGLKNKKARNASKIARTQNYGGYLKSSFSQIGIATFEGSIGNLFK